MSPKVLGFFGLVPFTCSSVAVQTFKDVSIQHEARYTVHDVIGANPVPEYIGPGQTKVSFALKLTTQLGTPTATLALLKTMQESGESYRLLLGPNYMGKYYLHSFSEDQPYHNGLGAAQVVDVTLNLEEDKGFSLPGAVLDVAKRVFA